MAEDAALGFLLDTLKDVLNERANLIAGAKTELGKLKNEFEVLKKFLKESSRISNKGDVFEEIERQVREVVYEAEDMLETCMIEAAAKGKMWTLVTKLFGKDVSLAQQVRSLRNDKVTDMYDKAKKELDAMKNRPASSYASNAQEPQQPRFHQQEIRRDKLVGFADAEKTITGFLTETTAELDVISIIGMAGLGKTTLARKIYDSRANLCTRVWITVSGNFNKRQIFLDILSEFTNTDNNKMSDDKLGDAVRSCLKRGKYLIIFDDVWSVKDLAEIKNFLPATNSKGKVIITTREEDVAKIAGARKPHRLRFLKPDESWELLQFEVFGDLQSCPRELANTGERIADKCDGLPLAISMIGGILRAQTPIEQPTSVTQSEWDKVFENMPKILKGGKVSEVIALSYNRLPDELRECFLYLGVFPEDHVIPSWELTRLWIAEGFVQKKEEHESLEKTAEWCLRELVNRSLLIVSKISSMGKVKMCRVHDAVRAFCISKAAELNVFKEMDKEDMMRGDDESLSSYHHRRICLHSDPSTFLSAAKGREKVRSFLSFPKTTAGALKKDDLNAFDLLRVLYYSTIRFCELPDKTKKLMHLRYITLDVDHLQNLPKDLSHLWFLQTLVVHTTSGTTLTVKANIWRMIRLRHLKTNAVIRLDEDIIMKDNNDNNNKKKKKKKKNSNAAASGNLQTLSNLSTDSCTDIVSEKVSSLTTLGIHGEIATLWETKFLKNLHHLEKLKLVNKSGGKLHRLPEPDCFPPNLKRLTLSSTYLNWIKMSQLAKIKTLEVLKLKDNAFAGSTWSVDAQQVFPRLQFLLIADADLLSWEGASADNFPRLNCLSLNKCKKLKQIPPELVEKLQKLDMHRVRQSVYEPAKKIIDDQLQKQDGQRGRWATGLQLTFGDIIR